MKYTNTMRALVLLNSRSAGINNGLTYETGELDVKPGMLVKVQLRKKSLEGVVISIDEAPIDEEGYKLKPIEEIVNTQLLMSETHLKTLKWIAGYYYCPLRSALTPFLPTTGWKKMIPEDGEVINDTTPLHAKPLPELTAMQKQAYDAITKDKKPALLFGVTGSGKTEVYAHLIADAAKEGKQSILLVPEILLTEHTIRRIEEIFDRKRIAVIHSRLTPAARRKEWIRIRKGEAMIVIGSRSALFAPCRNLGLVIMDEEHEWTYKNEQTPRYHARETAETLCNFAGAKFVMGTATPSLESWTRVKTGQYTIARMPERYQNRPLPTVKVIDLAESRFGQLYPFSNTLLEAIEEKLNKKEQCVLFLNRRGVASAVLCLNCRKRLTSPESQLPFTMHKNPNGTPFLLDHFSGVSAAIPSSCPHCGSHDLLPVGAGTQKLEDILAKRFPNARVLRADSDTLQEPEQMKELLRKMRDREADILLGTQSVVKGLDLPGVTLAAVLVADVGLSLPHFRAGERVFQLLTQLTGRSGRVHPGEVIIQTFRPNATEVVAASQHRTEEYLEAEWKLREELQYPPVTEMIRFIVRTLKPEQKAKAFHADLLRLIADKKIKASAMCAPTIFGGGKVWHILLRGMHLRPLLPLLDLHEIVVDVDPLDCI